jgi:hypothetical protein
LEILDSLIHKERNDDVKTSNFYKKIYYIYIKKELI